MKCECGGEFCLVGDISDDMDICPHVVIRCSECRKAYNIFYFRDLADEMYLQKEKAEALLAERDKQLAESEKQCISIHAGRIKIERKLTALQSRVDGLTEEKIKDLYELELGYCKNDCKNKMIKEHGFTIECNKCLTGCSIDIDRLAKEILTLLKEVK